MQVSNFEVIPALGRIDGHRRFVEVTNCLDLDMGHQRLAGSERTPRRLRSGGRNQFCGLPDNYRVVPEGETGQTVDSQGRHVLSCRSSMRSVNLWCQVVILNLTHRCVIVVEPLF